MQDSESTKIYQALRELNAAELREMIRDLLDELEDGVRERAVDQLVAQAARKGGRWVPEGPTEEAVSEIVSYAEAAMQVGYAEPRIVDAHLRCGSDAFCCRDYGAARRIFGTLLPPIGTAELYLGQHELVSEVLTVDEAACAIQYVVSVYMTADSAHRASTVRSAIDDVVELGHFRDPVQEMERVAVEPLPDLDGFLRQWRKLLEEEDEGKEGFVGWSLDESRWLREVVQRMEGMDGLAKLARSTRHGEHLRAWCRALVESRNWKASLAAFDEAAEIVRDRENWRSEFLDGAALAAQELRRRDLPVRLERAWRASSNLLRLRRWLSTARTKVRVRKLAAEALEVCPNRALHQRAALYLVLGDYAMAAEGLAKAPGLGWSGPEHPGHLLFAVFEGLLEGRDVDSNFPGSESTVHRLSGDEREASFVEPNEPCLRAAEIVEILELAGVQGPIVGKARMVVLDAMRKAAEKRLEGVTKEKRRRYYAHAARLIATCTALDPTSTTHRWMQGLRDNYSRYSALQREFRKYLGEA